VINGGRLGKESAKALSAKRLINWKIRENVITVRLGL
jgi:hypothetical protein